MNSIEAALSPHDGREGLYFSLAWPSSYATQWFEVSYSYSLSEANEMLTSDKWTRALSLSAYLTWKPVQLYNSSSAYLVSSKTDEHAG